MPMPFRKILVAIDGSEASDHAFATAVELAVLTRAKLTALAVEGPLTAYAATVGEVYDLVVLGHRGHFVRDRLLGSTADRVAEHAPCPVMIVR
jgi:nucleotide-binding universal stress UspA family protein